MGQLTRFAHAARRAARKPPHVIARRAAAELRIGAERFAAPRRARQFDDSRLLAAVESESLDALWERLRAQPYLTVVPHTSTVEPSAEEVERVLAAAEAARRRTVDLLGTGP